MLGELFMFNTFVNELVTQAQAAIEINEHEIVITSRTFEETTNTYDRMIGEACEFFTNSLTANRYHCVTETKVAHTPSRGPAGTATYVMVMTCQKEW